MQIDEFKLLTRKTFQKLISGNLNHKKMPKPMKLNFDTQLKSLRESVNQIDDVKNLKSIMTLYEKLFQLLNDMGQYADDDSKSIIADGVIKKITSLLANSVENPQLQLQSLTEITSQNDYVNRIHNHIKLTLEKKIKIDKLIVPYQMALWLIQHDRQFAKNIFVLQFEILNLKRRAYWEEVVGTREIQLSADEEREEYGNFNSSAKYTYETIVHLDSEKVLALNNKQLELSAVISTAEQKTSNHANEFQSAQQIKALFFSRNNNNNVNISLELTKKEVDKIRSIAPLFVKN
ncbi:MAG: hypothetical protein HKM04_06385 [Legionellales bacterium]|nr:hypothetical protein [Legionellales bacterium]